MNVCEGRNLLRLFFCVFKENNMLKRNMFLIELYFVIEMLSELFEFFNKISL